MVNDYRGLLALLSGLAGIVLLIVAFRVATSKSLPSSGGKRATAVGMYGVLFLTVGALLWIRRDAAPDVLAGATVETASPGAPISTTEDAAIDSPPVELSEVRAEQEPEAPVRSSLVEQSRDGQEQALLVMDSAAIRREGYRDRQAAPARLESALTSVSGVQFPTVAFERGTAELTSRCKTDLQRLAAELKRRPELKIEIRAYGDSLSFEANNFALTQTRASAVRDFLVVKGVPASRLIAQGFGGMSASDSPIAFVVRR